jgi:indolepyruvate ferredoxin oxidoreductase
MPKHAASLQDKFDLAEARQLLSGTQAIVRLVLMQKARDRAAGLNTAGYVSGYRGSPIAMLEAAFERAGPICKQNDIVFHPGLNEDLAATAIWGTQQAELRGEGKYDGVFAVWYGKGPGVDRSGDVFRHANHAGTSRHGGVLALMGDDHTCESSTSAHQSEFAFLDAMMPILNPAGVQEILDYGLLGFALSRYAGVWVGLKCVKDNIESTATVDGRVDRVQVVLPDEAAFAMPLGGLNIRLVDTALAKEARLFDYKRAAMVAFLQANKLDRIVLSGGPKRRVGIITLGKSYLDTLQALDELGLDEVRANALGLSLMKLAMTWPIDPKGVAEFCHGLDLVLVVEEKRMLVETQVKELLFDTPDRPRVLGKFDEDGKWLFPAKGALDPLDIALALGERLLKLTPDPELEARVADIRRHVAARALSPEPFVRTPYFCAGCPHNTSTRVPEGSRAYAGIGCHYMAQWMDRDTQGFTQMGGEGANWIGEAPFSRRGHVFQNLGDGTYLHSGSLAIRAAHAANVDITFKILFNDAVAMTGGQRLDGKLTVPQLAAQVAAEGVARLEVVSDDPGGNYVRGDLPPGAGLHHRRDLDAVQRQLAEAKGVTVLIYDQTCAAEKRRRRRRGEMKDPDTRVFINPAVCEGCGDCGVKSNCVAVLPLETDLGRKRRIDQSSCNKDFSCVEGFCPSFVLLEGAKVRRTPLQGVTGVAAGEQPPLPEPARPGLPRPYALLVAGIGGTGVVTVSAVLAQAAHIAGLGFGSIDVTGLAQKGGAVACHMRIAKDPQSIHAIRIGAAHADLVLGGDLVVAAANKILETVKPGHTALVHSTHEITTGDFTKHPDLVVPGRALSARIAKQVAGGPLQTIDALDAALRLLGDSLYANMLLLGLAYQLGHVPIAAAAIEEAIRLNGASVEANLRAFRLGRLAGHDRAAFEALLPAHDGETQRAPDLESILARRAGELVLYQNEALARRYREHVARVAEAERRLAPGRTGLAETFAKAYFKLLAVKDEYEVARLHTDPRFDAAIAGELEGVRRVTYFMAPPLIGRRDPATGELRKMRFGPWLRPVLVLLAKAKGIRGTWADVFGYTAERRQERAMIADYERLIDTLLARLTPRTHATILEIAALPLSVRGFGHVKARNHAEAKARETALLAELQRQEASPEQGPAPAGARAAAE